MAEWVALFPHVVTLGTRGKAMGEAGRRTFPAPLPDEARAILQLLLHAHADSVRCYDRLLEKLAELRDQGWTLVVITNGIVAHQSRKMQVSGFEGRVDQVVISEAVGAKKPAPEIFAAALDGFEGDGVPWMVGDRATADIQGGQAAGCRTGWVSHGRGWPSGNPPTVQAVSTLEVLERVVELEHSSE